MPSSALTPESTKAVGRAFDRVASIYDATVRWVLGETINTLQASAIAAMNQVQHVAIIGGGTGEILQQLLKQDTAKHYHYIEASARMEALTKNRLTSKELEKVSFSRTASELEHMDIIILPFILDCYPSETIRQMLTDFQKQVKPGGQILIIDFNHDDKFGFRGGYMQRGFIRLLYLFFASIGGSKTIRLANIFAIADSVLKQGKSIASGKKAWLLARAYQTETK